jgi:pSer/pThr/pTyr-binding forkhead associated (FHA) protein
LCAFCGATLSGPQQETRRTDRLDETEDVPQAEIKPVNVSIVPDAGLGIYLESTAPVTIMRDDEIILGRQASGTGSLVVDLVPFGAIQNGVSRRHAVIRRSGDGYEVIDLSSTNGTWVNGQRLAPDTPHPLLSGDIIRLGRLNLLVLYRK